MEATARPCYPYLQPWTERVGSKASPATVAPTSHAPSAPRPRHLRQVGNLVAQRTNGTGLLVDSMCAHRYPQALIGGATVSRAQSRRPDGCNVFALQVSVKTTRTHTPAHTAAGTDVATLGSVSSESRLAGGACVSACHASDFFLPSFARG